jgi:hypothetical protein
MSVLPVDRSEVRPLLSHVGLCLTVASGLGFVAGGLAGLDLKAFVTLSRVAQGAIAVICIASCFAIFWCAPDGPDRWRPFIVSSKAAEVIFGLAATVIALGGIAAVIVVWLG